MSSEELKELIESYRSFCEIANSDDVQFSHKMNRKMQNTVAKMHDNLHIIVDEYNDNKFPHEEIVVFNGLPSDNEVIERKPPKDYNEDLKEWAESFCCGSCGCEDTVQEFTYNRTCASGDIYSCKACSSEVQVSHKPVETDYFY